jgi:hypothetical protein
MRILCVCDFAQVRSVAMANILKARGYDVTSAAKELDDDAIHYLDAIKYFQPTHIIWMCEGSKPEDGFIGRDIWGSSKNKELILLCEKKADELGFKRINTYD